MKKEMSTPSSRPFTRSQRSRLLLSLPDHLMQMVFDCLSTKHAAILSSVNVQLRDFALSHTPAAWQNISIELKNAEKLKSLLIFLSKLPTNAKSLEFYINSYAIDINVLQIFPVLPNVRRLILSRNRWLYRDHLELLANRMLSVTQLEIDGCTSLRASQLNPTDGCIDIIDRHYGRQLRVFSCVIYSLCSDMMALLMSHSSNMIKFNLDETNVVVSNPVVASMLDRSPDIGELICSILVDADTQTFLFALSSCRQLTHLNLRFVARGMATPIKLSAFRAAFGGLTKLKILKLFLGSGYDVIPDPVDGEGQDQNFPFQLNSLDIRSLSSLHAFFYRLVLSQIEYVNTLTLKSTQLHPAAPDFSAIFTDLFTEPRPRLRKLTVGLLDYSSERFTPPEAGYRHILNHTPALERLSVLTKHETVFSDHEEILLLLAREHPRCEVEIDYSELSAKKRLAIAARSANE